MHEEQTLQKCISGTFQYNLEMWSTANKERSVRHILKLLPRKLKEFVLANVSETHSDFTFSISVDLQAQRLIVQYLGAESLLRCAETPALLVTARRLEQPVTRWIPTPPLHTTTEALQSLLTHSVLFVATSLFLLTSLIAWKVYPSFPYAELHFTHAGCVTI